MLLMAEPMTAGTAPIGAVVIGAGPAGLAAAADLVRAGTHVTLVDGSPRFGGQYWRHGAADDSPSAPSPRWHHGWSTRSEEHTSELQSRGHLVCRLLLEKKKKNISIPATSVFRAYNHAHTL